MHLNTSPCFAASSYTYWTKSTQKSSVDESRTRFRCSSVYRRRPISLSVQSEQSNSSLTTFPSSDVILERIAPIDYESGAYIASPTSEWQALRLMGQSELDIRVVLYRDHASWCPYCHKVQLLLEAKKVPYVVRKENMNSYGTKSAEFLKLNPPGLLPVILLDGELKTESTPIMFLLEETFQTPYKKMIATEDSGKMQSFHSYMRLERLMLGAWLGALRSPVIQFFLAKPQLMQALDAVDNALSEYVGPFFFGEEPSFIDIVYAPILGRLSSTIKYFRNLDPCDGRENLAAWFSAMEKWEPYRKLMSDDYSYALSIPPQIGKVNFLKERNYISLNIDNQRSKYVLNDGPEKLDARNEAAERLLMNFDSVIDDARKGSGDGTLPFATLSLACRAIASVLQNPDVLESAESELKASIEPVDVNGVVVALKFMRMRCCTPRDMTVDALEQFCGAINWLIMLFGYELV